MQECVAVQGFEEELGCWTLVEQYLSAREASDGQRSPKAGRLVCLELGDRAHTGLLGRTWTAWQKELRTSTAAWKCFRALGPPQPGGVHPRRCWSKLRWEAG
jgi:hypothetical protein